MSMSQRQTVGKSSGKPWDPLRLCPQGCLFHAGDRYCAWHGLPLERFVGQIVGNYRIQEALSDGAFGAVYAAVNVINPEFVVAMKLLKPPHCYRLQMVDYFLKEAIATKGVHSVNIPAVYDVHRTPWPYINMALVEGVTLEEVLRQHNGAADVPGDGRRPLSIEEAEKILCGVARALAKSHARGLIHRDLKPHNVMVMKDASLPLEDRIQVVDWGISLSLARRYSEPIRAGDGGSREIVGTFPYMAPEAFEGRYYPQTDIYSFGVLAYRVLTGQKPFQADSRATPEAWRDVHKGPPPRRVRQIRKEVPRRMERLVDRCLATDSSARYPNGQALLNVLEKKRGRRLVASLTTVLLVGVLLLLGLEPVGGLLGITSPEGPAGAGRLQRDRGVPGGEAQPESTRDSGPQPLEVPAKAGPRITDPGGRSIADARIRTNRPVDVMVSSPSGLEWIRVEETVRGGLLETPLMAIDFQWKEDSPAAEPPLSRMVPITGHLTSSGPVLVRLCARDREGNEYRVEFTVQNADLPAEPHRSGGYGGERP